LAEGDTAGFIPIELEAEEAGGAIDDAEQWFAEAAAPGAHGGDVAGAGGVGAGGVSVHEAGDVAVFFLAGEGGGAIDAYGGRGTAAVSDAAGEPDATLAMAEEDPALLHA